MTVNSATDALDAAECLARHQDGEAEPSPDTRRFLTAVHALRQIERAVVTAAINLGARDGVEGTGVRGELKPGTIDVPPGRLASA